MNTGKQLLFFCGCGDGSCDGCKKMAELEESLEKTSTVKRDQDGNILSVTHTRTEMALRRLLKKQI